MFHSSENGSLQFGLWFSEIECLILLCVSCSRKTQDFPKRRFESQGFQKKKSGTDAVIRLILQNLIIAYLIKNIPDFFRQNDSILSAFAKLPKATISPVMYVCLLSVCPHRTARLPLPAPNFPLHVQCLSCCIRRNLRSVPVSHMNSVHIITP
jgi:hypothetical protein